MPVFLFKTLTMYKPFEKQSVYLYPDRIVNYSFEAIEVWPMRFNDTNNQNLEFTSECEANEHPDFYSVFVIFPSEGALTLTQPTGRDCIADCATQELANQIEQLLLTAGKNYVRD